MVVCVDLIAGRVEVVGLSAYRLGERHQFINAKVAVVLQRLITAAGETGWYGGWYRTVFDVSDSYEIALDRYIARVINVAVCAQPVGIENAFYEFMEAGVGPQSESECCDGGCGCSKLELLDRGSHPTQVSITAGGMKRIRVYASDARDYGKSIVISGKDNNGRIVRTLYNGTDYNGEVVVFAAPFVDTVSVFSEITGIEKDKTVGDVLVNEFDIVSGEENLLAVIDARDRTPSFRRYYVNNLSACCCSTTPQVEGLAKLEYVPVEYDTDFLVIGNIPALKEECEAIKYGEMDNPTALAMADKKHRRAVRLLQDELSHYMGKQKITVNFNAFGTAKLANRGIGTLV
jgi:hypothetical protein